MSEGGRTAFREKEYEFQVAKAFNRKLGPVIRVRTATNSAACGVSLPLNRPIILHLSPGREGTYRVSLCGQLVIQDHKDDWETLFSAIPD